jgi:hypothetical protein
MRFRSAHLVWATAMVLALAVALFVSRGLIDTLLMMVFVVGLTGMYGLRRYAREELVYRRNAEPRRRH